MPMQTRELIPQRVSFTYAQGVVDTEGANGAFATMLTLMNTSDTPLYHHIMNSLDLQRMPLNFSGLMPPAAREVLAHPRMGWMLVISTNKALTFMTDVLSQLAKIRYRSFTTTEAAIEFLKEVDSTLDWSQMNEDLTGV
jgi:hypothetical protein